MAARPKAKGSAAPEPFKCHALKVAEKARDRCGADPLTDEDTAAARFAEIQQWKHHVCDLHRVLSVSQDMFLMLEHQNEAMLRVAIEIVCCKTGSDRVLWWTEDWYSDEEKDCESEVKRVWFREMVFGHLNKINASMNVEVEDDTTRLDELSEELTLTKERAQSAEAAKRTLQGQKEVMEKQVAELESQKQEMAETNKELQKAMERLSAELKNKPGPGGPDQNLLSKLAELEAQLKKEAQEKAMLQEKLTKAEASKGPVGPTEADMEEQARLMALLEAKLKAEQDRATQAERKMKEQASELAKIKGQPPKTVAATGGPAKVVEHEVDNSEELDALQKEMDAESRRADKLSKENKDLQAELERLRKMNEELRNAEPETRVVEVQREVSDKDSDDDDKSPGRNGPRPSQLARDEEARKMRTKMPGSDDHLEASGGGKAAFSQAMWDEKVAELNKANKKVMTQKDTIRELKEENAGLNERCDKMLKMLHQLKEQLKRVTEIAEARGCGDLVKSILEDAGVTQTLNSEEFTCFDRLYEDAKRRMEKQRIWDEQRMGLRPKSPMQERARAMLNNRAWAPGGAQQFSMTDPGPGYGAVQGYGFGEPNAPTITPGPFVSPGMGQTAPQMSMPMNSAGATLKISDSGSLYGPASQWCPTEKNSMPAPVRPGGQSPTAQAGQHISPASMAYLQNRGGDFMAEAGEYDFDMGMHVVGFAPGAGSRPGSTQTDPNSRANTPGGARRAGSPLGGAARSAPIDPSKPVMARKRFANSQSLTSLSAMALDVQGSSPLAANDRVSNAVPNRRKIIDSSKTLGRLDDMKPSAGMMMDDGSPILIPANNIWAGINHGEFSDRPKGPGMFRGFKLVGSRSQHDLSPLQGGIPNAFQM